MGVNIVGGIGPSHSLGYALGSPFGIPHGITSCLTLGKVVKLKAQDPEAAEQIARILPFIGMTPSGDNKKDAVAVGDAIIDLVKRLGLETNLKEYKVGEDQIPKIVKMGTGKEPGDPLYEAVEGLVKTLY
jgi:alcohol dehydrogenase class IV